MADFKRDLLVYAGINATTGDMLTKGNIRMLGNGSSLPELRLGELTVTGNAVIPGVSGVTFTSLSVAGNVTSGTNFIGNGALLSGVLSTLPTRTTIDIIGNVIGVYANVSDVKALVGNVGNVILEGGNITASGQINVLGNIVAPFFVGNGSQLTGLFSGLPATASIDISGNVIGAYANVNNVITSVGNIGNTRFVGGNIAVSGQVNAIGNVVTIYVVGNGSQLTGLFSGLPATANIDIFGNVIGAYANVTNIIAAVGNVGNTRMVGGNVAASGQVNALGNVVAGYLIGNGSRLTGLFSGLPATANIDIFGNVIGAYANVTNIIATVGNIGNTRMVGGNIAVSGQVNAIGNVVAGYFIGNGSQLSGVLTGLPATANIDIFGNVIGAYANVTNIIATVGNIGNTRMVGGNVTVSGQVNVLGNVVAGYIVGNGSQLTGIITTIPGTGNTDIVGNVIGAYANVNNIIAIVGNVGNTRFVGGNIAVSGQVNAIGNVVAGYLIGNGSLVTNLISVPEKIRAPNFKAFQTIPGNAPVGSSLFRFDTKDNNFDNSFYNSTDAPVPVGSVTIPAFAFLPNVAGYYMIGATTRTDGLGEHVAVIYKNGVPYANGSDLATVSPIINYSSTVQTVVYLNGTTDYVQAFVFSSTAYSSGGGGGISFTWFDGILISTGTTPQ